MKKRHILLPLVALSGVLGLSACNNKPAETTVLAGNKAVAIANPTRTFLVSGETYQLDAHSYGTIKDKVKFSSSNTNLATVSDTGLVTALSGEGVVTITAESVDDPSVRSSVNFSIIKEFKDSIPGLNKALSQIKSLDIEEGLRFEAEVEINLGQLSATLGVDLMDDPSTIDITNESIKLPIVIEVQNDNKDTEEKVNQFVKVSIPLGKAMDDLFNANPLLSLMGPLVKGKLLAGVVDIANSNFKTYLDNNDYMDFYSIDFYNFGGTDLATALTINFGDDENPDYRPFAFETGSVFNVLGGILDPVFSLINGVSSGLTNGDSFSIDSLMDLFKKDNLCQIQKQLLSNVETSENVDGYYTKATNLVLVLLNGLWTNSGVSGKGVLNNNCIEIGYELPTSFDDISFNVLKTDDKISKLNLNIKANDSNGNKYDFVNINLNMPTVIGKEKINNTKEKALEYKKASEDFVNGTMFVMSTTTNAGTIVKEARELYDTINNYGPKFDDQYALDAKIGQFLDYYYDPNYASSARQDILYPMYRRISTMGYGSDIVTYQSPSAGFNNESESYVKIHHYVNYKEVYDYDVTYSSSDSNIISVDENGLLHGNAYYNGEFDSKGRKMVSHSSLIKIEVKPKENATDKIKEVDSNSINVIYTGKDYKFFETSRLKENDKFNVSTHELTLGKNETFDLKNILNLNSGDVVTYDSKDENIALVDENGIVQAKNTYEDSNKNFRNVGAIAIRISSTENGITKNEEILLYINLM